MENKNLEGETPPKITAADLGLNKKRGYGFKCCAYFCSGCLIIIILFLGATLYAASLSGLIKIPILTERFYKEPLPISLVVPDKNAKKNLEKQFENLEKTTKPGQKIDLSFTEGELTYLLQNEVINKMGKKMKEFPLQAGQIAIKPDFIEFYGKIKYQFIDSVAVVHFVPTLEKEKLSIKITHLRIGSLSLPEFVLSSLEEVINKEIDKQMAQIKDVPMELTNIQLKDGKLVVSGKVKKE